MNTSTNRDHFNSSAQLAADESFIRWITLGEDRDQWENWLNENPDKKTIAEEARYIIKMMDGLSPDPWNDKSKNELLGRIKSTIATNKNKSKFQKQYRLLRWSLTAAATFALVIWLVSENAVKNIVVHAGQKEEVQLPEMSIVTVNAGSRLRYNQSKFKTDREIRLEGEAFFKVNPGSKFTVTTLQGTVTVLGTSFNVISRPGQFEVSCYTGKVAVKQGQNDKVEITPGEKCYAGKLEEKLQLKTFDASSTMPGWTQGKFTFDDQPLSVVVGELERQYDVTVKLAPGIEDMKYTGLFESGDLEKALSLITWPLHLKAQTSGKTISISR
jgi:ferric-dicitrate binding protein FerR (iron transport regulator)